MKDKILNFRIPEKFLNEYKDFCEKNSFIMSKRIRKLMESDLERWKKFVRDKENNQEMNP
jgi:hypothetical protein